MILIRRTPAPASILVLALTLCTLLLAFGATASAAPEGGEGEPPLPQLSFEPGSYDFGLQQANSYTSQANLLLRNTGAVAAPIYSFELSGGSGAFWMGPSDCFGRTLGPGESCSTQVNFNPYDAVPFSAQLRTSSEGGTSFSADISGEGGRARFVAPVDPTNFGATPVGSAGVTRTIDVTNTGNMAGGVFIAVIAGGAVGSFQLLDENCSGILLGAGATCNLIVRFQPIGTGAKTARLGLFGDSEGGAQITLTGVGLDPEPVAQGATSANTSTAPPRQRAGRVHRIPRRAGGLARRRIALSVRRAAR